jgi:hypothetical protein
MRLLNAIGEKHGTDKVNEGHTHFGKSYMDIYEKYFDELSKKPIRFLEIGVLQGNSLRSWQEYFPKGEIHGIDINPKCKEHENTKNNIFVHILDCSDEEALSMFMEQHKNYFDVILDDGSHINNITVKTFKHLYPCLKSDGYYIIEDLAEVYLDDDLKDVVGNWSGCDLIRYKEKKNDPDVFFNLLREIHTTIDLKNGTPQHMKNWVPKYHFEYLHHYPYIILMKKNEFYKVK